MGTDRDAEGAPHINMHAEERKISVLFMFLFRFAFFSGAVALRDTKRPGQLNSQPNHQGDKTVPGPEVESLFIYPIFSRSWSEGLEVDDISVRSSQLHSSCAAALLDWKLDRAHERPRWVANGSRKTICAYTNAHQHRQDRPLP